MKWLKRLTRLELVLIYLVIVAGSIVRMTGSGMGCPDWPKCFGLMIPPTERSQLEWQPEKEFHKGQVIIKEEALKVARNDFTSGNSYNAQNWNPYEKHDYAEFVPVQTWIEFLNRLIGAVSGIPMLIIFILALFKLKSRPWLTALSFIALFLLGFEAWLGKLVVDGNLIPGSITIHMLGALGVVTALLGIFSLVHQKTGLRPLSRNMQWLIGLSIALTLMQIIFGTQVREQIDVLNSGNVARGNWIEKLNWQFKFHRSFSILVFLLNGYIWFWNRRAGQGLWQYQVVMLLLLAEIATGVIMAYFAVPRPAQPLHLVFAALIYGFQSYTLIQYAIRRKAEKNYSSA